MGKLGRFACIFAPMVLTIASLLCLILVFSGQLNKNNSIQRDLYFFKVRFAIIGPQTPTPETQF
jgi:hypothetical protein